MTAHDANGHRFVLHADGFAWAVIDGCNIPLPGKYRRISIGWRNDATGHVIGLDN